LTQKAPWYRRVPWLLLTTLASYAAGVYWRWLYIMEQHDPRQYVYSDMKMYMKMAERWVDPEYILKIGDVTHPPATAQLFAWFLRWDPTLQYLTNLQFAVCCAVPISIGLLGAAAFGRKTAMWSVIVASFYFPYVDYGGYFLSEIYMMALIPLCMAAYLMANQARHWPVRVLFGIVAGGLLFVSVAFKTVGLLLIGFAMLHVLFARDQGWKIKVAAFALMVGTFTPGATYLVNRCSTATGKFCIGSNKSGADFLMGHSGRVRSIRWKNPNGGSRRFASPSWPQHGYKQKKVVPFAMTDGDANKKEAWRWIKENKMKAWVLSVEHIGDSFGTTSPWPSYVTKWWATSQLAQQLFMMFLMLPAFIRIIDMGRTGGIVGFLRSRELIVISPIFGIALAVFIATGEARYRLPFDAVLIVVGIQFYRFFRVKTPAVAPDQVEPEAIVEPTPRRRRSRFPSPAGPMPPMRPWRRR